MNQTAATTTGPQAPSRNKVHCPTVHSAAGQGGRKPGAGRIRGANGPWAVCVLAPSLSPALLDTSTISQPQPRIEVTPSSRDLLRVMDRGGKGLGPDLGEMGRHRRKQKLAVMRPSTRVEQPANHLALPASTNPAPGRVSLTVQTVVVPGRPFCSPPPSPRKRGLRSAVETTPPQID